MADSPGSSDTAPEDDLADRIARVVLSHPSVVRLDGGSFGEVATYLPGRRVVGIRLGEPDEPVEVSVVLRLDQPLPAVVDDLRSGVAALAGGSAVNITVADVLTAADSSDVDTSTP